MSILSKYQINESKKDFYIGRVDLQYEMKTLKAIRLLNF